MNRHLRYFCMALLLSALAPRAYAEKTLNVALIPYFAWNNLEEPKMSVWLPLNR